MIRDTDTYLDVPAEIKKLIEAGSFKPDRDGAITKIRKFLGMAATTTIKVKVPDINNDGARMLGVSTSDNYITEVINDKGDVIVRDYALGAGFFSIDTVTEEVSVRITQINAEPKLIKQETPSHA